jgi:predicted metal-dependent HD superfamily phosphohydrolase
MTDVLRRKWQDLLSAWSVDPTVADQTFEEVRKHYARPGRFYHTLDHIRQVMATVENLHAHARNLNAVKLAGWLHDAIYDSKASDNEERSADYAERLCTELSLPEGKRVAALIRKTRAHDADEDVDARVLCDADLAILGASEPEYRAYAEKIRLEYGWVPEVEYRRGRRRILESFLNRPGIYHFLRHLEESARRNLVAEIARLAVA